MHCAPLSVFFVAPQNPVTFLYPLIPRRRQVIDMAYFGGYTHAEIAELLHIPLGTVKERMRLGLHKMKLLLEESGLNEN